MAVAFDFVLPVHNEQAHLAQAVARLAARLVLLPNCRILLVENGSTDDSWPLCQQLEQNYGQATVPVLAYREPAAGIGHAYHRGLRESLNAAEPNSGERYTVLTAADLPFGFSDLDGVLARLHAGESGAVFVGSKAHADSQIAVDVQRKLATLAYRAARRLVLGMRTADSQGTVFVPLAVARSAWPRIVARGFFYSTELIFFAEQLGASVVELPVVLEPGRRASTVKPVRHGAVMAAQLVELATRRFRS
ncbi:MAG: glycosyltransferase [Myxococcales bacterium]|nr:glycosyltransferase [Myxococcales bacterium]